MGVGPLGGRKRGDDQSLGWSVSPGVTLTLIWAGLTLTLIGYPRTETGGGGAVPVGGLPGPLFGRPQYDPAGGVHTSLTGGVSIQGGRRPQRYRWGPKQGGWFCRFTMTQGSPGGSRPIT